MSWSCPSANRLSHSVSAFIPASHIIAGYVNEPNNAPVEGALISTDANGGYDITDSNGCYEIWVPHKWSGTVIPTKNELPFAPSERTYNNVITNLFGQNYKDIDNCDLDGDGLIDWRDVAVIHEHWLEDGPDVPGDIHKDEQNIVNFLDFADFAAAW
jgi:hypothetical protein